MTSTGLEPRASLPWLIRMRWLAVVAQLAGIVIARVAFDSTLPYALLFSLVALTAASNLGLAFVARRLDARVSPATLLGGALVFDTVTLTLLLAASGGPMNPFTVLYLVQITLSAIVLSARWTTAIAALSIGGFGALFLVPGDPHALHGPERMGQHLQGMWIAFTLAVALTGFFIRRVASAIASQREQIARLRETSERNARLAAVTTLAAGAAHELGSPLGTIAVAAHEARLNIDNAEDLAADLDLIALEVERCNDILSRMAARVFAERDDAAGIDAESLRRQIVAALGDDRSARVRFELATARRLLLPAGAAVQSATALIKNGLDASAGSSGIAVEVSVSVDEQRDVACITVSDSGAGIAPEVISRVGEPFFTTKQPGRGLGLGVFLARAFVESRGGTLTLDSTLGRGTRAAMHIPLGAA